MGQENGKGRRRAARRGVGGRVCLERARLHMTIYYVSRRLDLNCSDNYYTMKKDNKQGQRQSHHRISPRRWMQNANSTIYIAGSRRGRRCRCWVSRINDGKFAKFTNFLLVVPLVWLLSSIASPSLHIFHFRQLVYEL